MKKTILLTLTLVACLSTFAQYHPTQENLQARKNFQDMKFGIFIHWGIYSMLGSGEWVMNNKSLNYEEYPHLADGFYPAKFNADEWTKTFKEAGAQYITFTTRHHDGFSMFKTEQSSYNIVDGTPYGKDVLRALADACDREGLSLHLYYSHLDWGRPDYPLGRTGRKLGRPTDQQNYDSYFQFMNRQLTELLTHYGKVGCIWFDGWWDHDSDKTPFDWRLDEQYAMIHKLQPACLIGNNHHQTPYQGEDIQMFEQDLPGQNTYGLSGQDIGQLPLETCLTMNGSWGYDITDKKYKTVDFLIQQLVGAAGRNANLLLNVGPRPDGELPLEAVERLKAIGKWMKQNGETIYGTRGGLVAPRDWGVTTQKGNTLYVHILKYSDKELFLPVAPQKVAKARLFAGKQPVGVLKSKGGVLLQLPAAPKGVDTIVEVTLK